MPFYIPNIFISLYCVLHIHFSLTLFFVEKKNDSLELTLVDGINVKSKAYKCRESY